MKENFEFIPVKLVVIDTYQYVHSFQHQQGLHQERCINKGHINKGYINKEYFNKGYINDILYIRPGQTCFISGSVLP